MIISPDPKDPSVRAPRDITNYRGKIDADSDVVEDVTEILRRRDFNEYHDPDVAKLKEFKTYADFAYWKARTNEDRPHRLGGGLDGERPLHLDDVPPPVPNTTVEWTPPAHKDPIFIEVLADGTIVHKDKDGKELPGAHHYLHAIFNDILYQTRDLLEAINVALEDYADDPSGANEAAYGAAVLAFNDFERTLQPGGVSPYSKAFTLAVLRPVITYEGFIINVRVKLNWKNPYHSSSTIKIP